MLDKSKFSRLTGLTDNSAKTIWNKLRRKLADAQGGVPADPSTDKKTKAKTPAKRKTAEEGDNGETPTKKPRGRKPKAAEAAKEEDADEEEQMPEEEAT
jgi:hypothetical protein